MTFRIDFEPSVREEPRATVAEATRGGPDPGVPVPAPSLAGDEVSFVGEAMPRSSEEVAVAPEIGVARNWAPGDEFEARAAMEMEAGAETLAVEAVPALAVTASEPVGPVGSLPSLTPKPRKKSHRTRPRPALPRRRRALPQFLVSALLGLLGAAAGYYGARYRWVGTIEIHPLVEPIDPILLGGLLGLLVGWLVVRWTAERH